MSGNPKRWRPIQKWLHIFFLYEKEVRHKFKLFLIHNRVKTVNYIESESLDDITEYVCPEVVLRSMFKI